MTDKLTSRQGELLAEALVKCLVASGIVHEDAQLTGPHLLLFADDLERMLKDWNTRPAAPVEGLELDKEATAENIARHISKSEKSGRIHEPTYIAAKAGALMALECSQAEAIIAVKEAERAEQWRLRREMEADLDTQKAISASLQADNAALTARVKYLETENSSLRDKLRNDDLETQLAAARKALEEVGDAKTELNSKHDYSRGWNDALFRTRQIARAALGARP